MTRLQTTVSLLEAPRDRCGLHVDFERQSVFRPLSSDRNKNRSGYASLSAEGAHRFHLSSAPKFPLWATGDARLEPDLFPSRDTTGLEATLWKSASLRVFEPSLSVRCKDVAGESSASIGKKTGISARQPISGVIHHQVGRQSPRLSSWKRQNPQIGRNNQEMPRIRYYPPSSEPGMFWVINPDSPPVVATSASTWVPSRISVNKSSNTIGYQAGNRLRIAVIW